MYFVGLVIQCYTADKLTAVLHCIHVGLNRFCISPLFYSVLTKSIGGSKETNVR